MNKIGFLGPKGTFTYLALQKHIAKTGLEGELIDKKNIQDLFKALIHRHLDAIFIPIENSIEGPVTTTLDLLIKQKQHVIQTEVLMKIKQSLITKKEIPMNAITDIYSHYQPIAQCQEFIQTFLPNAHIHITPSTANAAEKLCKHHLATAAILGHKELANLYNLHLLKENVQDHTDNLTRFILLGKNDTIPSTNDKTSIVFTTPQNQPGSLCHILSIFAKHNVNLTKIESRPSKKALGQYLFLVDCNGHQNTPPLNNILEKVQTSTNFFKCLGSYPIGKTYN